MAGTIDSAIERKRDKDPGHVAEKQRKLESETDPQEAERRPPHESPRETPEDRLTPSGGRRDRGKVGNLGACALAFRLRGTR
jgi:hypothetical protein